MHLWWTILYTMTMNTMALYQLMWYSSRFYGLPLVDTSHSRCWNLIYWWNQSGNSRKIVRSIRSKQDWIWCLFRVRCDCCLWSAIVSHLIFFLVGDWMIARCVLVCLRNWLVFDDSWLIKRNTFLLDMDEKKYYLWYSHVVRLRRRFIQAVDNDELRVDTSGWLMKMVSYGGRRGAIRLITIHLEKKQITKTIRSNNNKSMIIMPSSVGSKQMYKDWPCPISIWISFSFLLHVYTKNSVHWTAVCLQNTRTSLSDSKYFWPFYGKSNHNWYAFNLEEIRSDLAINCFELLF